jgi:hypothetical protein
MTNKLGDFATRTVSKELPKIAAHSYPDYNELNMMIT